MSNQIAMMAERLSIDPAQLQDIVINTIMPARHQVTNEQFVSFLAVANEYGLNPLTKQIYAFPSNGAIQPIVSIDGWMKIINDHPQFNGMSFEDSVIEGALHAVKCKIYRKDRDHAIEVTEYMAECRRNTPTWKQYPSRMLRHKAAIQAARYAFGFSGIVDPDEGERIQEAGVPEKDMGSAVVETEFYPDADFEKNFSAWSASIKTGSRTSQQVIDLLTEKGVNLSQNQKAKILGVCANESNENN